MENELIVISPKKLKLLIADLISEAFTKLNTPTIVEPSKKEFLTIQEAAAMLNLAVPTIYSLVFNRAIPHNKIGEKLYFSEIELNDWIRKGRKLTKSELIDNSKSKRNG